MAANSSQLQETILKAIDAVVTQRNNELKLDKTITGIIKKNIGKRGTKPLYQVEYAGGIIEAITQNAEDMYVPHTSVYVLVPQSDFSKEKIIIGRATSISTEREKSVVAAAVNRYSIVGGNLLESKVPEKTIKDLSFGLHSFHDKNDDAHGIEHRAQFLYQRDNEKDNLINFKENKAQLYKEESSAIMVRADFLTNLDIAQRKQAGASYGLIFNFVFDNLNAGYGETNGEILNNISEIIKGTVQEIKEEVEEEDIIQTIEYIHNYALKNYIQEIEETILAETITADISNWITDGGLIDSYRDKIQLLYENFQVNTDYSKLDRPLFTNTIEAYLSMLDELKLYSDWDAIQTVYNNWKVEKIGESPYKYEQFVLSSDDMLGNPMSFGTWNTQYIIFKIDLDTFQYLDSILFYKEGFLEKSSWESQWPIGVNQSQFPHGEPDIFVRNLQIYTLNELDAQSGDYLLKVEPYGNYDNTVTNDSTDPETGIIIPGRNTKFKATLLRKAFEDLTNHDKVSYYWFKENSNVINASHEKYNYLAGAGWSLIEHKEEKSVFSTTGAMNPAYKNNYKCVAVYEPSTDDKTILTYDFVVYNESMQTDIKLESDLGVHFSFDAGNPTISVLINEERTNQNAIYQELGYDYNDTLHIPKYKYNWAISDAVNDYTLFLNEIVEASGNEGRQEAKMLSSRQELINKIKKYVYYSEDNIQEIESPTQATRITYPVSISSSGFTVTCYVQKNIDGEYIDVGSASLDFSNEDNAIVPENRLEIVNGDQIFQYDEYGKSPCSTTKKDPLTVKSLKAKVVSPKGIEVSEKAYNVEWIFPIENTMIIAEESLTKNPATGLIQTYAGVEAKFSITQLYDPDAYTNQITCHVTLNGKDYYKDTNFYFGKIGNNGTNGTDVVARIEFAKTDGTNLLAKEPLTLNVQKYIVQQQGQPEKIEGKGFLNVGSPTLQEEVVLANENDDPNNNKDDRSLKLSLYQKESLIDEEKYAVPVRWNISGNSSNTTNNTGKYFEIDDSAQSLKWKYDYNSDTDNKHYFRLQNIKAIAQLKTGQTYYAYYNLPIIEYEPGMMPLLQSQRIAIENNFYLKEITYNSDGRRPIYNHNQGLKLNHLPNDAVVIWEARGGSDCIKYENSNNFKYALENSPDFSLSFIKNADNKNYAFNNVITVSLEAQNILTVLQNNWEQEKTKFCAKEDGEYVGGYAIRYAEWEKEKEAFQIKEKQQAYESELKKAKKNWIKTDENTVIDPTSYTISFLNGICKKIENFENELRSGFDPVPENPNWIESDWWDRNLDLWYIKPENYDAMSSEDQQNNKNLQKQTWIIDNEIQSSGDFIEFYPDEDEQQNLKTVEEFNTLLKESYSEEDGKLIDSPWWKNNMSMWWTKEQGETFEEMYLPAPYPELREPEDLFAQENPYPEFFPDFSDWNNLTEEEQFEKKQKGYNILEQNEFNQNTSMVYVLPNDIYNGSATNNRIEAKIYTFKNDALVLYATVYAPIYMSLDTFGLESVNAWDGNSITIDEDRGAILAPQIGAGEKDSNNRFTGIVMGKTETYSGGSENEKQIGLFGYAYGAQSIFLDAETGNADFGLPDGTTLLKDNKGNVVGYTVDNYNEGRIELRPGDVSKIGGWRLGRRSLYYIEDGESIGPKYNNDYVPDASGAIKFGDRYNAHHEKDIPEDKAGILLHSGNHPYFSIKGKKLNIQEDGLSESSLSYLRDDDSLEVQIDPNTPTLFTIFRHNGSERTMINEEDPENPIVLYPEGSRTYLAGINGRGQLVANGLQNATQPSDNGGGETITTFGVNTIPAFGETIDNASYIGLLMDASDQMVAKIFVKDDKPVKEISTVFITGSGNQLDEYTRPISMHGQNINLYAKKPIAEDYVKVPLGKGNYVEDGNGGYREIQSGEQGNYTLGYVSKTTDANIQISTDDSQIQIGGTKLKLFRENTEINELTTTGQMSINIGLENARRALNVNAGTSTFKLHTGRETNNNYTPYYSQNIDTNGITINTTKSYDYSSSSTNYKINTFNNKIEITNQQIIIGSNLNNNNDNTNNTNYLQIYNSSNNGVWKTDYNLDLITKNHIRINATKNGNNTEYNSSTGAAQILIQAGSAITNENATQLFLNSSNNTWGGNGSKQNSWFRVSTTRTGNGIYLYDKIENGNPLTYFNVDAHQLGLTGQLSVQQAADKIFFNSTSFSGAYQNMSCDFTASNLKAAINTLAARIAQVAYAFNQHSHNFSTSTSERVDFPSHTGFMSSATLRATSGSATVTKDPFGESHSTGSDNIASGDSIDHWEVNTTHGGDPYVTVSGISSASVEKSYNGSWTPSPSYTMVTLDVDETCYVPDSQKINNNF